MKILVIPARGGSKRIPKKNIIDFYGQPIISYPINSAIETRLYDFIHVSTDDIEIRNCVKKISSKVDVSIERPSYLSSDTTTILDTLKWLLFELENKFNTEIDSITMIYPCAPLIDKYDIFKANNIFECSSKKYPLLTFAEFPVPIEWAFTSVGEYLKPNDTAAINIRSQDITKKYYESGPICIFPREVIINGFVGDVIVPFFIDRIKAVDIDNYNDLEQALCNYNYLNNKMN
jgi:CMP-N-acetylneuraminic acid synthetase